MINTKEEQIRLYARQLKIPTFANYVDTIRQCAPDTDFSGFLLELMMAEAASRQESQTRRRMKAAAFPFRKTLDEFDMTQLNPSVSPVFLRELASCKFIDECRNIVMIGNPGRGKTHIAIALGIKACLQGYRVLFRNASTLSTELTEARDSYQLGKIERQLARTDLLILDELSYLSFNKYESDLMFKVLSDRSERSSTIVTTNLPFSKWTELFENTTMVSALENFLFCYGKHNNNYYRKHQQLQKLASFRRTKRGNHRKIYARLERLSAWLGDKEITKENLTEWKEHLTENGYEPVTVNSMLAVVNTYCRFVGLNIKVKFLRIQRKLFREESKELNKEEYEKLIRTAEEKGNTRLAMLIETIGATGIRVSEVQYITVEAAKAGRTQISLKGKIWDILLPGKLCKKLLKYAHKQKIASGGSRGIEGVPA